MILLSVKAVENGALNLSLIFLSSSVSAKWESRSSTLVNKWVHHHAKRRLLLTPFPSPSCKFSYFHFYPSSPPATF